MADKQKLVEDKKQELLRRIAEKKRNEQSKQPPVPTSSDRRTQNASNGPPMFVNDGNFLARFQAMQQQQKEQTASTATTAGTSADSRPTVSMKLTTVKKTMPVKPVSTRPDVFEAPEDFEENGKFEIFEASILLAW